MPSWSGWPTVAKRPPTSMDTLPDGTTIEYWDAIGADGKPQQRRYTVNGERTPSVSTIAKYLDPDPTGLMYWSSNLTCEGVAQLAGQNGGLPVTGEGIKAALREAKLTWRDVRDQAAQRGTDVHERIFAALSDRSTLPDLSDLSDDDRGFGQAAIRWWGDRQPRPIMAEAMTADAEHGFVGRFDLLCELDGERVLVDAKTRLKLSARLSDHCQLAGYRMAIEAAGQGEVDRMLILILGPDGEYREVEGEATDEDFLAALSAYQSNRALAKRMRDAERAVAHA